VEFSLFCLTHFCLVPYDCAQLKLLSEIWGPLYTDNETSFDNAREYENPFGNLGHFFSGWSGPVQVLRALSTSRSISLAEAASEIRGKVRTKIAKTIASPVRVARKVSGRHLIFLLISMQILLVLRCLVFAYATLTGVDWRSHLFRRLDPATTHGFLSGF
jgi:hypothetical protein